MSFTANSLGQIFALNYMLGAEGLGMHYLFYGLHVFQVVIAGKSVSHLSKLFPRVTMCDFTIRQMSNFHKYTVECALPINLFNEKIFILMWFWLVMLTILNIFSIIFWISSAFLINRTSYVKKYLIISEKMRRIPLDRRHLPCFAEHYLRQDGVFTIRMLSKNTNDVIVSEVVCKLWDNFILHHGQRAEFHRAHPLDIDLEMAESRPQNGRLHSRLPKEGGTATETTTPVTPGNIFP